ncbi:PapC/FimD family outer membrane usher protein [Xenorhabdus sp. 12]|uniref:PapC/FimD family outer membrane usher protein n=1 Tax=Xenorhabdus santafensis TaxID=2582833 RepID=A0ABU4S874_9GAMM|nr:fimbria/pilus outer membrane usher protein [Xenorhabdus sp. 12]MDX7986992.1 PapC/FimD family outer membrane usher protein [Xenorhabdus sp. 12]
MNIKQELLFPLHLLKGLILFCSGIHLANAIEFNIDMLDAEDKKNIDLSRFSQAGYVMPGKYQLTLRVNEQLVNRETMIPVYSRYQGKEARSEACISPELRNKIGLKEEYHAQTTLWNDGQCVDFSAVKGVVLSVDLAESQLNMTIPLLYLEYSDLSWLPPARWDEGIPGVLIDYNVNTFLSKSRGNSSNQNIWLNGTVGANYGAWRLRGNYQGNYSYTAGQQNNSDPLLKWDQFHAYRALTSWQANLTLGEYSFASDLLDGWNYTGVSLASDERQLPPKLRGYAPQIRGFADTNARVTVTQQNNILYDTTVPAGEFVIKDISSSVRGTLDVKITEQDGRVKTFQVSTASVSYLTRPGQLRYKLASGRARYDSHRTEGPIFATGEWYYGLTNSWTLYGGGVVAGNYNALALGAGVDLGAFGSLTADVTQSMARLPKRGEEDSKKTQQGKSWHLTYSKRFDDINTDLTLAGYRFSERDYMSMQQYLDARYRERSGGSSKDKYTIILNKSFPEQKVSLGVSYNHETFWNAGENIYYNIRMNKYFSAFGIDNMTVGLLATRSRYLHTGKMNNSLSLNFSLPVGEQRINYNHYYSEKQFNQNMNLSGQVGERDNYNVTASMSHGHRQQRKSQFSGYYSHRGNIAHTSFNVSMAQDGNVAAGMAVNGGATLTLKGAALHPSGVSGGTRLIVDTNGVENVPFDSGHVRTNHWGVGVVTSVSSYYRNTTMVDINKLDSDVEARDAVAELVLTEGAIGYHKFDVLKGNRLFVVLKLENGSILPFGTSIRNKKSRELGIVNDGGVAWISGAELGESLQANWGEQHCSFILPPQIDSLSLVTLPCQRGK